MESNFLSAPPSQSCRTHGETFRDGAQEFSVLRHRKGCRCQRSVFQCDRDSQAQWSGSLWLPAVPTAGAAQTGRKSYRGTTGSAAPLGRKPSRVLQTQIISTDLSSSWELFSLSLTGDY